MESAKGFSWYEDVLKKAIKNEVTCDKLNQQEVDFLISLAKENKAQNAIPYEGGYKFCTLDNKEALYLTKEGYLIMPSKGNRFNAREIWKDAYVDEKLNKLKADGVGFVMRKGQDCTTNLKYQEQVPRKFIGNYKTIEKIINESDGDLDYISRMLDLGSNYFKGSDELVFVKVDLNKFTIDLPNGNEPGAYEFLWMPGGQTKNRTPEAVLVESGNLIHNNNWNSLVDFYGEENIKYIKKYDQ